MKVRFDIFCSDYVDHQDPTTEHLQTFLLTCAAPDRQNGPLGNSMFMKPLPYAVSVVNRPCEKSKNLLRVRIEQGNFQNNNFSTDS